MEKDGFINMFGGRTDAAPDPYRCNRVARDAYEGDPVPFSEEELAQIDERSRRWAWIEVE